MTTNTNSISTTAYHPIIWGALNLQMEQYAILWNEVQSFGAATSKVEESERWRLYYEKFGIRVDAASLIITILVCDLLEALANYYISIKTDSNEFKSLERKKDIEKWTTIPRLFNHKYDLPKSGQTYQDLSTLIERRNAFTHPKPLVKKDDVKVHEGNISKGPENQHKFILRSTALPIALLKNLWEYDQSRECNLLIFSCGLNPKDLP